MPVLRRFWSTDRSLTALLVMLSVVIFVIDPLGDLGVAGSLVMSVAFSLLLISGVGAVARSVFSTALVGGLVLAALAVRWLRWSLGGELLDSWNAFFSALFCVILAVVVLLQVFREGPITSQRVQGAVAVYLLLGLAWAFVYEAIALRWPQSFAPVVTGGANPGEHLTSRFVYFSFITLTTVGYGDITAVHPVARALATAEALTGQLFPAILLARLVSMELYYRQAEHR
jgi:voltage-gated potassium channel Kch